MLRHELYSMIHVPRLEDSDAADLFLGFHIRAVSRCHFAVLPRQSQGGFRTLKRFANTPVPVGAKMVVEVKACVVHVVPSQSRHRIWLCRNTPNRCISSFLLLLPFYLLSPGP